MVGRSTHRRRQRRLLLPATLVVFGLVAASCGGDDDDSADPETEETSDAASDTTDAPEATESADDTEPESTEEMTDDTEPESTEEMTDDTEPESTEETDDTEEVEGKVLDHQAYVGGSGAADPGLEPIKIGYLNMDGGAIVVSGVHDDGVDIAVEYINTHAGGIDGHPLEVVQCFIANTEEEGQQCGQQFANDDEIVAIISGPTVIGTQAFYAGLDGSKPVVHGVSVSPVDLVQPNVAVMNGGAAYVLAPFAPFAQEILGVESAALVYSEETQSDAAAGQAAGFEALGIPVNVVSYPQGTPDLTAPLLAADALEADLVMPVIAQPECVQFAEAQRQLGIPDEKVLASPVCLNPATIEGLGDFPEWYYAVTSSLGIDPSDPAIPPYIEILSEQGQDDLVPDPWVLVGYAQALTLGKWLNELGVDNLDPDSVLAEMRAFTGPYVLGAPELDCGKYPEAPAVCGDHTQFYKYNGPDEGFTHASEGRFFEPPEGWQAPS